MLMADYSYHEGGIMSEDEKVDLNRTHLEVNLPENKVSSEKKNLKIKTSFQASESQKIAIEKLFFQLKNNQERSVLLGVTGSGKTFAMANLIERYNRPTLILSHNKTLARQLYNEISQLFPNNAVEYFVSHYDYYQPEAYLPQRDLYIDKELSLNERIEQERFSTVASLVSRSDVIVVSSVSCIYGLNPPETFLQLHCRVANGMNKDPQSLSQELVSLQYSRTKTNLTKGDIRLRGDVLDIWMPSRDDPFRIRFNFDGVESIHVCDSVTWEILDVLDEIWIHPKEFFMTSKDNFDRALNGIENELDDRLRWFRDSGMDVEAQRLEQRTKYDLEMLREIGHCSAIENYSMHFDGRSTGERPYCLLDFFSACAKEYHGGSNNYLVLMDESHVTLPQVKGMFGGDRSRKNNLIEHGFRLPSAADNRPLKIDEFQRIVPQMVYVSATPGERELRQLCEVTNQPVPESLMHIEGGGGVLQPELSKRSPNSKSMHEVLKFIDGIAKMELRPTGLLDPKIEVRPTEGQVQNLLDEIRNCIENGERVLVTVLTIKFAEEVSKYLLEMNIKSHYLHSEIDTIERTEIIKALRIGLIDVIVGINLLREGLDLPEVGLVAIFDADREGFLRNERSLLQTIGRASRNSNGRVIMYADSVSNAMQSSISQTIERREFQIKYNQENGIIPQTVKKELPEMGTEYIEGEFIKQSEKKSNGSKDLVGNALSGKYKLGAGFYNTSNDVMSRISQPIIGDEISIEKSNNQLENMSIKSLSNEDVTELINLLNIEMKQAAANLDFELAAQIRDKIFQLEARS